MRSGTEQISEFEAVPFTVSRCRVHTKGNLSTCLLQLEHELNPDEVQAEFTEPEDQFAFLWYQLSVPTNHPFSSYCRYFLLLSAAGAKGEDGKNQVCAHASMLPTVD